MSTQKYDRFKAAPWFQADVKPPVLIGGGGGIGSWLTVLLTRAGFECHVFDFDMLEEINMAGQLYMHKNIGSPKVEALAAVTRELCREEIIPYNERMDKTTMTNDIVFSAFDNMKARRDMFEVWLESNRGNAKAVFIDGRLTMEQLTIFTVRGNDAQAIIEYEQVHLFDDSKVPDLPCSAKQTSHGAAMIAAHMVESFTNWYCGVLDEDEERDVFFFWSHFMPANFTSKREANAIELAQEAMQEDQPLSMEAQADLIETADAKGAPELLKELLTNGKDITPDLPGIDGQSFTIQMNEEWANRTVIFGPDSADIRETLTLSEARERAAVLGLSDQFEQMIHNHYVSTGHMPDEVTWLAESIMNSSGSDQMNFEGEGLQGGRPGEVRFDSVEEVAINTLPVPPEEDDDNEEFLSVSEEEEQLDETPDPEVEVNIGGQTISLDSINLNAMWETTSSNMVVGTDPYVPDPTPDQDLTASERI